MEVEEGKEATVKRRFALFLYQNVALHQYKDKFDQKRKIKD